MQLPAKRNDLDGKAGPSSLKLCRPCLGPDPGPGMHRRKRTQIATGRSDDDTTDNPDVLRQPSAVRRQLHFDNAVFRVKHLLEHDPGHDSTSRFQSDHELIGGMSRRDFWMSGEISRIASEPTTPGKDRKSVV